MGTTDIKVGEAIAFCDKCIHHSAVFEQHEATRVLLEFIKESRDELSKSERQQKLSNEQVKMLKELLTSIDKEFDHAVKILFGALDLLSDAFPERQAEYEEIKSILMPDGIKFIITNYRNEAGEAARIKSRVERNPNILEVLTESQLNDTKLISWYNKIVEQGERLANISDQIDLNQVEQRDFDGVILEFKAHQKWRSLVTTIKRMTGLAGWSETDYELIFDEIDTLSAERGRIRRSKKEEAEEENAEVVDKVESEDKTTDTDRPEHLP